MSSLTVTGTAPKPSRFELTRIVFVRGSMSRTYPRVWPISFPFSNTTEASGFTGRTRGESIMPTPTVVTPTAPIARYRR